MGAIPCDSGRSVWTEDGFLAPEGLPPTTSVFRVVVGRSWLMGVCCTGHWLVGGFTKLRFRGTGDSVEVEGHGEGGGGNTAAQARSLILLELFREKAENLVVTFVSSMCLFITSVYLVLCQRL